jgi:hypothetical protein
MSSEDRVQYLRDVFGARATEEMIQEFATASRTELMDIANEIIQAAAQETRKGFLAAIGYFFSFKWWGKKK